MSENELFIDEVILQPDNALIRRKGQFNLNQGGNLIDIGNLDPNLDPKSIQLIVSGKEIIIHNMKFELKIKKHDDQLDTIKINEKKNWK